MGIGNILGNKKKRDKDEEKDFIHRLEKFKPELNELCKKYGINLIPQLEPSLKALTAKLVFIDIKEELEKEEKSQQIIKEKTD